MIFILPWPNTSVADPDPGSGAFLTPGLRSRISNPYFLELGAKVLGKKFYNSFKNGQTFFSISKIK
jgi:hypothetical protein